MKQPINLASLTVAILSSIKLILQSFQIDIIDDEQINSIANGVAAIGAIVGVFMTHRKKGGNINDHIRAAAESAE